MLLHRTQYTFTVIYSTIKNATTSGCVVRHEYINWQICGGQLLFHPIGGYWRKDDVGIECGDRERRTQDINGGVKGATG